MVVALAAVAVLSTPGVAGRGGGQHAHNHAHALVLTSSDTTISCSTPASDLDTTSSPVVVYAAGNTVCLQAGIAALGVVTPKIYYFEGQPSTPDECALWASLAQQYPEQINGMEMHTYFYIEGKGYGSGFKVQAIDSLQGLLDGAGADSSCASTLSADDAAAINQTIETNPVAMWGWSACPCTNIAKTRFASENVCHAETIFDSDSDPTFKYLQCLFGAEHHSFVFFDGQFYGNGFDLDPDKLDEDAFMVLVNATGADLTCTSLSDKNIYGEVLQPCAGEDEPTAGSSNAISGS